MPNVNPRRGAYAMRTPRRLVGGASAAVEALYADLDYLLHFMRAMEPMTEDQRAWVRVEVQNAFRTCQRCRAALRDAERAVENLN